MNPEHGEDAVPDLSVVIPTLGRETLISTIDSLLVAEHTAAMEVIVVGSIADSKVASLLRERLDTHPSVTHLDVSYAVGDSSEKKNAGWRQARSELVAFLDDDVIVAPDWPLRMVEAFSMPSTALVSGPGLVPPDVGLVARLAGLSLSSPAAGYVAWRYKHGREGLVPVKWSAIIGCNMAYRKSVLEEIGGFDPAFWPGEEMIAAYLTGQRGYHLFFCSAAYVYHYPRQSLGRFWMQMFGYGATRIRLIRGGVDREWTTLLPAAFVAILLVSGLGQFLNPVGAYVLMGLAGMYLLAVLGITLLMVQQSRRAWDLLLLGMIPLMHISYGIGEWWECIRPNRDLSIKAPRAGG